MFAKKLKRYKDEFETEAENGSYSEENDEVKISSEEREKKVVC